jgi:hypothetical protein
VTNTNPRPETADEWINAVIDGKLVNGEPVRVAELTEELMQSFGAVEARGDLPTTSAAIFSAKGSVPRWNAASPSARQRHPDRRRRTAGGRGLCSAQQKLWTAKAARPRRQRRYRHSGN